MSRLRILILGGTAEARRLVARLSADPRVDLTLSLAGATRDPAPQPAPLRIGGFGGADGLARYLTRTATAALIDATHPFAERISRNAAAAAAETRIPLLRLNRPEWEPAGALDWTGWDSLAQADESLPPGARALFATGRKTLGALSPRTDRMALVRMVDPPDAPLPEGVEALIARPPFDRRAEAALIAAARITHLVAKNSGGAEGRAKLDAAAAAGIPILMIRRPPPPGEGTEVATVDAALAWIAALAAGSS